MPPELTQRVISVIAKTQRIPEDRLSVDSTFEELGIDSLDAVNILFALEEEFQVNIPDEKTREIRSIRQMVEGLDKLLSEGGGAAAAV
jgi:acyl carrier protein